MLGGDLLEILEKSRLSRRPGQSGGSRRRCPDSTSYQAMTELSEWIRQARARTCHPYLMEAVRTTNFSDESAGERIEATLVQHLDRIVVNVVRAERARAISRGLFEGVTAKHIQRRFSILVDGRRVSGIQIDTGPQVQGVGSDLCDRIWGIECTLPLSLGTTCPGFDASSLRERHPQRKGRCARGAARPGCRRSLAVSPMKLRLTGGRATARSTVDAFSGQPMRQMQENLLPVGRMVLTCPTGNRWSCISNERRWI
jgi:hypothetical protein